MKFEIHDLGKIKQTNIHINDLTIFVGKNSTNKSYVAHTVYMLNKTLNKFGYKKNDSTQKGSMELFFKFIKTHKSILKKIEKNVPTHYETKEIHHDFHELLFEDEVELIDEVTFDFTEYDIASLVKTIHDFFMDHVVLEINRSFNTNQSNRVLNTISIIALKEQFSEVFTNKKITIRHQDKELDTISVLRRIFTSITSLFSEAKASAEEFYFPASRTGFVLAFDEIVSGVLRDRFGGQPTATKLTEPTIDFISGFADIKSGKFGDELNSIRMLHNRTKNNQTRSVMRNLFDFIEKRIVKGKIIEDKKDQNYTQFYLQPSKTKEQLDLHLTSSATVELLPLVIFLKHFTSIEDRLLVIEEPEAHLHPQAQIEMARLLVMLVNAGAKVLITTHSDYILSELSNCIKMSSVTSESQQKYLQQHQLTDNTIIDKERVSSYLFKDMGVSTEVIELPIDEYGIANDNFDDILDELLERTSDINDMIG